MNKGEAMSGIWGVLPGILARLFVLENLDGIEDFADAYAQHVGESMMRALYSELRSLLEAAEG